MEDSGVARLQVELASKSIAAVSLNRPMMRIGAGPHSLLRAPEQWAANLAGVALNYVERIRLAFQYRPGEFVDLQVLVACHCLSVTGHAAVRLMREDPADSDGRAGGRVLGPDQAVRAGQCAQTNEQVDGEVGNTLLLVLVVRDPLAVFAQERAGGLRQFNH